MRRIISLDYNGDPYGSGFVGVEETEHGGVYRGDIGAQSRAWWRAYARQNGYQLREPHKGR